MSENKQVLIEDDSTRQDFENYVRSINPKLLFLERWPSGTYKHDAIQNQWIGYRAAVLSASAGEKFPAVVFDSFSVWEGLSDEEQKRTMPVNVVDVLNSVVRLIKLEASKSNQEQSTNKGCE